MTSEERRVIECAQRAVAASRAYVRQRVRWEQSQSIDDMRARMVEAAEYHTAGLGNTRAELALIDAVDALDAGAVEP
jgi:hypothetical protein